MEDYQITSFSSGELTPKANGRIDTPAFMSGAKSILNGIVLPQGGVTRRPGTGLVTTASGRLIEFEGNDEIGYLLGITITTLTIYLLGVVVDTVDVTDIWTQDEIDNLIYATNGNVMWFTHQGVKTQLLTYTSESSWAIADYAPTFNVGSWDNTDLVGVDTDNCAGSITFYEGRAILSGSINWPSYLWGTDVKSFNTFTEDSPIVDGNAFEIKIDDRISPKIKWAVGARGVFVGTNRGVFSVSDENTLLAPTMLISSKNNSSYPVGNIPGFQLGGELFYIQKGKRKVRMAGFSLEQDIYLTPDITSAAEHITEGLIKQIAVQTLPETIIWAVLENGEILTFSYSQENKVNAWSRHTTTGLYKSIAIVSEGDIEVVYVIVERDSVDYLEKFNPIDFVDLEYSFMDCSVTRSFGTVKNITSITDGTDIEVVAASHGLIEGEYIQILASGNSDLDYSIFKVGVVSDINTFILLDEDTGVKPVIDAFPTPIENGTIQQAGLVIIDLDHLNGKSVFVTSGPTPIGIYTVGTNQITVEDRRTEFTVGYNYYTDIVPMNLAVGKNKRKRNIFVTVETLNSIGGKIGKNENYLDELKYSRSIVMNIPEKLYSGSIRMPHRGGSEFNGDILIRQDAPLPLTVLSLMVEVEVF